MEPMTLDPGDGLYPQRPLNESRTRVVQADDRKDYSDISSVAEDDVEMTVPAEQSEGAGEEQVFEAQEDWGEQFSISRIRNPTGDDVYFFSELYIPTPEVLARYRKQTLAMRVKTGKDLSTEEAYQQYKRACREYRTRLGEQYTRARSSTSPKAQATASRPALFQADPNFRIRLMQAQLKQVTSALEEQTPPQPVTTSAPPLPPQAVYLPPTSSFNQVLFDLPAKPTKRRRAQDEIVCKYTDQSEDLLFKKQVLLRAEASLPLYLNKVSEYEEQKSDSLLEKLKSTTALEKTVTGDAVILRRSFTMEFRKRPGHPGRIDKGQNPIHSDPPQPPASPPLRLFSVRKAEGNVGIPTRLNTELGKYDWLALVHPETRPTGLHRETSRLLYNLADGRMKFEIPEKTEQAAAKEDGYSRNSSEERRLRLKEKTEHINEALRNNSQEDSEELQSDSGKSESNTTNMHVLPSHQSRTTTLKHAKPAYDYIYLKKDWSDEELRTFHRPPFLFREPLLKLRLLQREPPISSTSENITAHNLFKNLKSLSLRKNAFALFEYIEKKPHLLGNYGMASKLKRYYKGPAAGCEFPSYVGNVGQVKCLEGEENIPLIGQLLENQAIAVLENNMTRTPVFAHNPRVCDFLLIRKVGKRGKKYYLRPLERLYTSGQQEPRKEVFIPKSRNTNTFLQNRNQAFIFNLLHQRSNKVTLSDLCQVFPNMNESTIRKTLKQMGCEQTRDMAYWSHPALPSEQQLLEKVSPEEVCQYESMRAGQLALQEKGISITSIDKLESAVKKVKSELNEDDRKTKHLANWIEEQLMLTPWNLTNSYISTKQSKGMMKIDGEGDPTSGHCGYSFIKVPMKLPHGSDKNEVESSTDPSKYQRIVTGTDADLRKLSMNDLMKKLMTFGVVRRDRVEGLTRWERVGMLKILSSQAAKEGKQGSITKYARGTRLTTKMMREEYQKTVNETFERMIAKLGKSGDYRADREEEEVVTDLDLHRLPAETQVNPQTLDFVEDVEMKEKNDLEALLKDYSKPRNTEEPSTKPSKIRVLRKETRIENLTDKTVTIKVQYIKDPKEIEEYEKRKKDEDTKEQLASLTKAKRTPATIEDSMRMEKGDKQYGKEEGKRRKEEEGEAQITCSRCGMKGHMKTNRKCPKYTEEHAEPSEAERKGMIKPGAGLKMSLSLPLIDSVAPAKRPEKRQFAEDYLKPKAKPRRRALPDENQYDDITHRLFMKDIYKYFHRPVKKEEVGDYYTIIQTPICLQDMSTKAKSRRYTSAQMYMDDLNLLVANAELYNGYAHEISSEARQLREEGLRMLREKELLVEIPVQEEGPGAPQGNSTA